MNFIRSVYKKVFHINDIVKPDTFLNWVSRGKPLPPPHFVKQAAISEARYKSGCKVFIETGTYLGDMVEAQKKNFKKVYSIELGNDLYNEALKKFEHDDNVTILQGDSGDVLMGLLPQIDEPAVFWLDGHYSEGFTAKGKLDTPVLAELELILAHVIDDHVILIDDARCFNGRGDYPSIEDLRNLVNAKRPGLQFSVRDDMIRIHK